MVGRLGWAAVVLAACNGGSGGDHEHGTNGGGTPGTTDDTTPSVVDPGPDSDGDGFHADVDCDDADAQVYPGAPDLCGDDRVTDCDRSSDEGLVTLDGARGFDDLGAALAAAADGSTIVLCPGTYAGTFVATVPVNLSALEDADTTVLSGAGDSVLQLPGGSSVTGVTIRGGDGARGGGIQLTSGGTLVLEGCDVVDNDATEGGGLYVAEDGVAILVDTALRGNRATAGGGAAVAVGGTLDLTMGGTASGNRADQYGGGVALDSGHLVGGLVSDNEIVAYSYPYFYYGLEVDDGDAWGGAGVATAGVSDVTGTEVADNFGVYGGGMSISGGATELVDVSIHDNDVYQLGGGLAVWAGDATLSGTTEVRGNIGEEAAGGVIVVFGTLTGGSVVDNYGDEYGGGVFAVQSTVADVVISGNETYYDGGGLSAIGEVTVTGCTIEGNRAHDGAGLATDEDYGNFFYYYTDTRLTVVDSVVTGNVADRKGGGVFSGWELELTDTLVTDNTADDGGGLYVATNVATVTGGAILRNAAELGGGVRVVGGSLGLQGVDLGAAADDNVVVDIRAGSVDYTGLAADTTEACTASGCVP